MSLGVTQQLGVVAALYLKTCTIGNLEAQAQTTTQKPVQGAAKGVRWIDLG